MKKLVVVISLCILIFSACGRQSSQEKIIKSEAAQGETGMKETLQKDTKQEDTKQEDTKQEDTKQEDTKQEDTKQKVTKQEEIIQDDTIMQKPEKPSYCLDLHFDPEKHTIAGTETVVIKNTSKSSWDNVCFRDFPSDASFQAMEDAGITDITNVTIIYPSGESSKGNLVSRDQKDNTIVYFTLEQELLPEEEIMISFDLCVHIPKKEDRFGYNKIGYNLGYFFPIQSIYENGRWVNHPYYETGECTYTECTTFDVKVTAPEGYTIITTGELVKENGNVSTFHAENVRDFTMVISDKYEVVSTEYQGININSYYVSGSEAIGKIVLNAAKDAIDVYTASIGSYPYKSLDAVEVSLSGAGGMEYPQLIMIDEKCYRSQEMTLKLVTAHETAHQWFYGIIGNDSYEEAWIDEGMATYLEIVYFEKVDKDYAERLLNQSVSKEVYSDKSTGDRLQAINQSVSDFNNDFFYITTVYNRAGQFLVTLRNVIGLEAYNEALHEIYSSYKFKIADTKSVITIFQSCTKEDLSALFDYYIDESLFGNDQK
jgi:predicted Holliday junction resolvase-like endonuclease